MKKGTIIRNHWAGENNPGRYFIYMGISGRYAVGIQYIDGKLQKVNYYKSDFADKEKFEPVGYCNAFDVMKADIEKLLN